MHTDTIMPYAPMTESHPTRSGIESWLKARIASELEQEETQIDPDARFASYGLDSMSALVLTGELEEWLGLELPSTLVWDFPTVRELAVHLESRLQDSVVAVAP
jgi:acyl carrier protein